MLACVSFQVWSHLIHVYSGAHTVWHNSFFDAPCTFLAPAKAAFAACFLRMVDNAIVYALVLCLGSWHWTQPFQAMSAKCNVYLWSAQLLSRVTIKQGYEEANVFLLRRLHQGCGAVGTE
uniref:Putative secreted protein n=1 Tax=Amblyomma triste TaxID=251400 RepID=A0A023G0P5_AMBTT